MAIPLYVTNSFKGDVYAKIVFSTCQTGYDFFGDIYNANGSLLLGKDHMLDANFIERLANLGVDAVYVKNPLFEIDPAEEISMKTRGSMKRCSL